MPMQLYAQMVAANITSYDILVDMNSYRAIYHLAPLEGNDTLCTLAKIRVEQIKTDWSHQQFQSELDKIPNMRGVFHENLARTFESKDVIWGWSMSLVGHKEVMLIPEMKYGCIAQSGNTYAFEGYVPN